MVLPRRLLADKEKVEPQGLNDDVFFQRQLPFVVAMVITIQYLENHILNVNTAGRLATRIAINLVFNHT
jgi:hypothetical protein